MVKPNRKTAIFIKWLLDSFTKDSDKIAVIDGAGKRETTYGELYDKACRVVAYLERMNLPAHSYIGISLPACMEYIASEIGIWLAGHAIVPMGDQFPETRIRQIMEHCESPFLIDEKVINEITSTDPIEPTCLPEEDDVNSLFYTSGSTGKPKGVIHTFRSFGIPLFPDEMFKGMDVSVMAVTAPMYFIACKLVYEFITRGGTVNIAPQDARTDIRKLEDYLSDQNIEFVFLPASVLSHFHNKAQSLKVVMSSSERLSGVGPQGYRLINHCGQTETAGVGTMFTVDKPYDNTPIGIPVPPYIYNIQDEEGNEVAEGEEGELCYRGDLTPGYFKEPELTAELYRGGWLHTGDIVKQLPDKNLVFMNRKDDMMKINGQRVEPNEIETVFKKIPGINDAIVKGFTDGNNRQYLCGYYISKNGVETKDITCYLSSSLPSYMVPSYFVRMDSFPLNINGKIDRKALASPIADTDMIERQPYAAPQNETERQLCEAFEQSLGISQIGIHDDFFTLGGDSIRVMQLQTLCPALPLSARLVYQHRTPQRIAQACTETTSIKMELQQDYPLSQTQLGIFAESMMRQGEVVYNNGMLFRLGNGVDLSRLAKACEAVVAAHPFVKTRLFIDGKGNPRQRRNDDEPYRQEVESLTDADFEALRKELMQPFFLLTDRLFRIRLFDTTSAAYLFMDFHHIIFDGYSLEVLMADLNKAYKGESLQVETWSGFEVAQEEEKLRQEEFYHQAVAWNKEKFGNLDIVSLPQADRHEKQVVFAQEDLLMDMSHQVLENACRRMGVTPNVLTTTVFGYLLGTYSHAQESLFATIYNGRKDLKTMRTIGMLVKTLPIHVEWQQHPTVRKLLQVVKQQLLGCMNNDLYSFNELSSLNSNIHSRVLFAWQGGLISANAIAGEPCQQLPVMENATGEMLVMQLFRQGDDLRLNAEYQANAYSQVFIRRMMQSYRQLLHDFVKAAEEDTPLSVLPLIPVHDQKALLSLGTGERLDYDTAQTITSLFIKQAKLNPDAIAVVDKDTSITYAELNRKSDVLAAILRNAQVSTDTFVGLMLPRRISFMIATLAVFKAGGAYIPLDYDYPYARLKYMLDDSQTHILITTRKVIEWKKTEGDFTIENVILFDDIDFNVNSTPVNHSTPSSMAYMIYTSGSTGLPKGVMVEHKGLLNFIQWLSKIEQLKAGEQCAVHTSFSFDGSVFDLFPPLLCGATLHILRSSLRQDLKGIYNYLVENKIVGMLLTTQLGMAMQTLYDLPLRFLMLGGEKLTNFKSSGLQLFNCYGPTEFTVCSSYFLIDQEHNYDNIPIGRPAPNTISAVVDTEGRLVPQGVPGELCLIGRQLSRGYWHREQQTREKFIDCPFLPGERMYRTGDLARWNEDGMLEYLGRIDSQTKLRGFRIELGEIENCINAFPEVKASSVILSKQNSLQFLSGFFEADSIVDTVELRNSLASKLPSYMVPLKLIQLDKIPLTPNGKIDRRRLEECVSNASINNAEAPANHKEQVLLDLTKALLETDTIGVTDDLTLIGLSSLDAIKLASLADEKGIRLKVNDILINKSIRNIAKHESSFGHWLNEYSPEKPIVVAIQGFSPHQVQNYFNALCEKFSVFNFASLDDYYNDFFRHQSKSDIVEKYVKMLHDVLPYDAQVHAFTGHCYAGGLAYRCAARWQAETGQAPKVVVLNTPFRTDDELRHMMPSKDIIDKMPPERQQKLYDWQHQLNKVIALIDGVPMPSFKGEVVLFHATEPFLAVNQLTLDCEAFARQDAIYLQRWQEIQPNIAIIDIPTDHFTMLEPQYAELFLKEI